MWSTPSEVWPYGWEWFLEILRWHSFFLCSLAGQGTGVGDHLFLKGFHSDSFIRQILIMLCNYESWFSLMVLLHSTFKGIVLVKMKIFFSEGGFKIYPYISLTQIHNILSIDLHMPLLHSPLIKILCFNHWRTGKQFCLAWLQVAVLVQKNIILYWYIFRSGSLWKGRWMPSSVPLHGWSL